MKDFNLSEKGLSDRLDNGDRYYMEEDVKEFIRLLKEEVDYCQKDCATLDYADKEDIINIINRLAGEELSEVNE